MFVLSDGLAADARHLAERSGCAITVELDRLPIAAGVEAVAQAAGRDAVEFAAGGGDDYELLVTAPFDRRAELERAAREARVRLTRLGGAEAGTGVVFRTAAGGALDLAGYEHE